MSLIQALLDPAAYPHPVAKIELIETHISWVLLTGRYAYKIKKNIQFDFLDFSTLDKRHFYCSEELRFNSRFAPGLYLDVVPITGSPQAPKVSGNGEIIEYAVRMKQFDGSQLLSRIADRGSLNSGMIDQLAALTANFHQCASTDTANDSFGTPQEIHHWFKSNVTNIRPLTHHVKLLNQISKLAQWGDKALLKYARLMELRKKNGFIRECHGDLHLGNIALINHQVTPFDGIEFNPGLYWIDVISEIAFVIMDLQQRGLDQLAYRFLNHYLSKNGDYAGITLLPYYLVYRALVRCKVALLRWQQHQIQQDLHEAESYADLAEKYSQPTVPRLLITHGYSGSGKSTLSTRLAEYLGMIHLRSDVERKRLMDAPRQSKDKEVNQGVYAAENVQFVYCRLVELASSILDAGFTVLIDAAFLQASQRSLFAELAAKKQVDFLILDFCAPVQELKQRVSERQKCGNDASEATLAVLEHQFQTAQAISSTEPGEIIRVDTCAEDAFDKLLHHSSLSKH